MKIRPLGPELFHVDWGSDRHYECSGRFSQFYEIAPKFKYSNKINKMQRYTMVFININALHVTGGSSAHHQELKTVYTR